MTTIPANPYYQKISTDITYLYKAGYQIKDIIELLNAHYPATFYWGGDVSRGVQHIQIEESNVENPEPVIIWQLIPATTVRLADVAVSAARGSNITEKDL